MRTTVRPRTEDETSSGLIALLEKFFPGINWEVIYISCNRTVRGV